MRWHFASESPDPHAPPCEPPEVAESGDLRGTPSMTETPEPRATGTKYKSRNESMIIVDINIFEADATPHVKSLT
jgi:hypothetical protein